MKKILITTLVFSISYVLTAQETFFSPNGNVGIGTKNPKAKLHVMNGNNSYGSILATADEIPFSLYTKTFDTHSNRESFRLGLKYNDELRNGFISFYRGMQEFGGYLGFSTNGVERMSIDRNGDVGIGSQTPYSRLQITGGQDTTLRIQSVVHNTFGRARIDFISDPGIGWRPASIVSEDFGGHNGILSFYTNGSGPSNLHTQVHAMSIYNGRVGIGVVNPGQRLHVVGSVLATSFNHSSDRRLKRNIQSFNSGLNTVMQLNPVQYEKKESLSSTEYKLKEIGFIAQDVQKILPQLVFGKETKDEYLALNYDGLIPVLTKAVQEQQKEISDQNKKIETLEKKVEMLENFILKGKK